MDHVAKALGRLSDIDDAARPGRPQARPAMQARALRHERVLMLTHPRSCGTCIELYLEQFGYAVRCNPFDRDYYFLQKRGCDVPKADASPEDRFDNVAARLMQIKGPLLVRAAAYTLLPHIAEKGCEEFLRSFDRTLIVARDPAYALPAHRRLLERSGHELTLEEAGYSAELALKWVLEKCGLSCRVLDAHATLANPAGELRCLELPERAGPVEWEPGMRDRWGLWVEWKRDVSCSTTIHPVRENPRKAALGRRDPFYRACYECYRQLIGEGSIGKSDGARGSD